MKKKEKIVILVLVVIVVILIIIAGVRNSKNNETEEDLDTTSSTTVSEGTTESEGEYVTVLEDGTKLNTSEALNEDKEIDGIEITDIQLTENNNTTQLLATLTNTSNETQGGYVATLQFVDENGEVLLEMNPYIPELEANESTQLNISTTLDYSDIYDFIITK